MSTVTASFNALRDKQLKCFSDQNILAKNNQNVSAKKNRLQDILLKGIFFQQ